MARKGAKKSGRNPTQAESAAAELEAAAREAPAATPAAANDDLGPPITTSELAAYLDMTPQRVTTLANEGVLFRNNDGTYGRDAARVAYIRFIRRMAATRARTGDKTTGLIETKTLKAKLDLAVARGEFVNISEVEGVLTEAFATLRNEFGGLGASLTRDLELRAKIDARVNDGIARVRNSLEAAASSAFRDSENDVGDEEAAA